MTERVNVTLSATDRSRGPLQAFQQRLGTIGQQARGLGQVLGGLAAAFAGRALLHAGREWVNAFAEQERAVAGLNASLRVTGQLTEANSRLILDQAAALQRVTTFGDEALIGVSATVSQLARELGAGELAQVQQAVVGIADALNVDLASAAQLVGKTIGSSTNALSRYGIQVDMSASQSERLAQIMAQTSGFFEVAQARTRTTGGAMLQLGNAIGDLKEALGGILADMITAEGGFGSVTERVFGFIDAIEQNRTAIVAWGRVVTSTFRLVWEVIETFFTALKNVLEIVGNALGNMAALIVGAFTGNVPLVRESIRALREDTLRDLGDITAQLGELADAWLAVADASARAQGLPPVSGRTPPTAPDRSPFSGGPGSPRARSPKGLGAASLGALQGSLGAIGDDGRIVDKEITARVQQAIADIGRAVAKGPTDRGQAFAGLGDATKAADAASKAFEHLAESMIGSISNAVTGVLSGSQQIEQALIHMITRVASAIPGIGGIGVALFGAAGAIMGALLGGGRQPTRPIPVAIARFDADAERQMQGRRTGPQRVTIQIVDSAGNLLSDHQKLKDLWYTLGRMQRRNAINDWEGPYSAR